MLLVQVPVAGNAISTGMIVGALASGSSTGSVKNMQMALDVAGGAVRVTGSSQSVNVATLQHALKDFQGRSNARVCIDAASAQVAELCRGWLNPKASSSTAANNRYFTAAFQTPA